MTAMVEETLSVSGILLDEGLRPPDVSRPSGFSNENVRLSGLQVRQQMVGRWFFMIISTFFSITPAIVYLVRRPRDHPWRHSITIGDIVAFTTLQSRLFFPLGQLLNVQVEIQGAFALVRPHLRISRLADRDSADRPNAIACGRATLQGDVRFDDVSFRYDDQPVDSEPAECEPASRLTSRHSL